MPSIEMVISENTVYSLSANIPIGGKRNFDYLVTSPFLCVGCVFSARGLIQVELRMPGTPALVTLFNSIENPSIIFPCITPINMDKGDTTRFTVTNQDTFAFVAHTTIFGAGKG